MIVFSERILDDSIFKGDDDGKKILNLLGYLKNKNNNAITIIIVKKNNILWIFTLYFLLYKKILIPTLNC